tara:strand:- start:91139 stop:92170 length:1032 start_codon:yes stop_codon:yes gene_type:complete
MMFQVSSVIEKILFFIQFEVFVVIWLTLLAAYGFYRFFLKAISQKRHLNLKSRFINTPTYLGISTLLSIAQWALYGSTEANWVNRLAEYIAFFSLVAGAIGFIKLAQIIVYLSLFYKNMSQGIPRLIANLFSFVFSIFVVSFIGSEVFSIHITAMLATSAVFSLVLGLALQDTLGNLFSGVAMQIGQPFKIGDWVEINHDNKKWLGQIQEITWRSTFLITFSDETVMIPNKTIALSQITIFSDQQRPNRESVTFRIDYNQNASSAKSILVDVVSSIEGVLQNPGPRVLLTETSDSWVVMKVFYSVSDFSMKFRIADQVIEKAIQAFNANHIKLAAPKITVLNS